MLTIMLIYAQIMLFYAYFYAFMLKLCFYAFMLGVCHYAFFYASIIGTSQSLVSHHAHTTDFRPLPVSGAEVRQGFQSQRAKRLRPDVRGAQSPRHSAVLDLSMSAIAPVWCG